MLEAVEAFADVPPETRERLASLARVEALGADEEVSGFGAALLVEGAASVCATIVDEPVSRAALGTLIPARGTLSEAVALRVVAGQGGARVALWDQAPIDEALRACPWVLEELAARADQLQARAAATMGPLGDLDEPTRDHVLDRFAVRVARAHEAIALGPSPSAGPSAAVKDAGIGVALVCAGSIEVSAGGKAAVLRAGDALLPQEDAHAKAGAQGAILLVADAPTAAELATGPLASILAPRSIPLARGPRAPLRLMPSTRASWPLGRDRRACLSRFVVDLPHELAVTLRAREAEAEPLGLRGDGRAPVGRHAREADAERLPDRPCCRGSSCARARSAS